MADYYPLLSRALEALSDTGPDMRRSVYERARSALTEQLRGLDPPLPESDIARERLSLDEAINRIEVEYARPSAPAAFAAAEARGRDYWPEASATPPAAHARAAPRTPSPIEPDFPPPEDLDAIQPPAEPPQRERPRIDTVAPRVAQAGRARSVIMGAALAAVIGGIAVTAWLLRDRPAELPREPPVVAAPQPPVESDRKITERVGGERAPVGTNSPTAGTGPAVPRADVAVAQRAVLLEENLADPRMPRSSPGRVLWRLDAINVGPGQPLETVVRATVEVQDAGMTLNMVMRRNRDQTLPASHTIELTFTTTDPARTVRDVSVLWLKNEDGERGVPLAGLPVRVKDNVFLIGLSNLPADVERNTEALTRRSQIDLPVVFTSGQRGILSVEKGVSGEQVINQAFQQWQ